MAGVARGQGIEVDAHMSIFDAPLYGYEGEVVIDYHRFDERITELTPDGERVSKEYLAGMSDVRKALEIFAADSSKQNEDVLFKNVMKQVDLGTQLGIIDGAKQENERYKQKADAMREASGGEFLFSRQEFETSAKMHSDKAGEVNTKWISLGTTLGMIQDTMRKFAKGSPRHARCIEDFKNCLADYLKTNNQVAIYKGAAQENLNYMAWLDKHIRAAGGAKSEAVLLERMAVNADAG